MLSRVSSTDSLLDEESPFPDTYYDYTELSSQSKISALLKFDSTKQWCEPLQGDESDNGYASHDEDQFDEVVVIDITKKPATFSVRKPCLSSPAPSTERTTPVNSTRPVSGVKSPILYDENDLSDNSDNDLSDKVLNNDGYISEDDEPISTFVARLG